MLEVWEVGTATSIFHNFLNNATDGYWHGLGKELAEREGMKLEFFIFFDMDDRRG